MRGLNHMIDKKTSPVGLVEGAESAPMSEHLIRIGRLTHLKRERQWNNAELARQCERTPQQVASWFKPKSQGGRQIGETLARAIEEKLGLPRFYLDDRAESHTNREVVNTPPPYGGGGVSISRVTKRVSPIPVLPWEQLPNMLSVDNAALRQRLPHLDTFAPASHQAKFVQVIDDSMAPVFLPGDHVLIDPAEVPRAGDTVLVSLPHGEHLLRQFRPRTAHIWEGVPLNDLYQPLSSERDGATVVAVMVEHRRYRRTGT